MSNKKDLIVILGVLIVGVVLLSLLNIFTSPIIEANREGAETEPLYAVMGDASGFEKLELDNLPSTVYQVWKEKSGKGYVVRLSTNKGFTGKDILITAAISSDGIVTGINLDENPETKEFGFDYPATYIGENSTLSGVELVGGVTYSSSAFKGAVADAFSALVSNGLVTAVEKEPEQIYEEMLLKVFGEALSPKGLLVADEFTSSVEGVVKAYKAGNNSAVCYWVEEDGENYTVVVSRYSSVVYGKDGKETDALTSGTRKALEEETLASTKDESSKDKKKVKKLGSLSENAAFTPVSLSGVYSSVTSAWRISDGGKEYWGFSSRPYGFGNETMVMYILLTSEGKIAGFSVKELIIEGDYYSSYTLPDGYYTSFNGLDSSWSGEEALISGATLSSDAVKEAINDAFDAYNSLKGGN